jgi:hypothetical protein
LNKEIELVIEKDKQATYADLLKICVNWAAPEGGFTVEQMKERIRLSDVIEAWWNELDFEDSDYTNLIQLVKETKWAIVNKEIIEFSDYILNIN